MKFVGDIPKDIENKSKNEIVDMIAFAFYRNITNNHLGNFSNINAYLNYSIFKHKGLSKKKIWLLLILIIQKENLNNYGMKIIEKDIDEVIDNIKLINNYELLDLANEISYILVKFNKNLSINPICNNSKCAFLKDDINRVKHIVSKFINEDDISNDIFQCYKFLKNKDILMSFNKTILLSELIFFDVLLNVEVKTLTCKKNILKKIIESVGLKEDKANLLEEEIEKNYF